MARGEAGREPSRRRTTWLPTSRVTLALLGLLLLLVVAWLLTR